MDIRLALELVAQKHEVDTQEVISEIEIAIKSAMNDAKGERRTLWETVPCERDVPTPEETILWAVIKVCQMIWSEGERIPETVEREVEMA